LKEGNKAMTFDLQDYRQFVELIYKHPEWRAELRQIVLTEELLALPELVEKIAESQDRTDRLIHELGEAQRRREEDLTRLVQTVAELAEAQKRSEERLTRLEQTVAELAEAQKRTEQRVEELAEAQKRSEERLTRLEQTVAELAEAQKRSEERLTRLEQTVAELAEAQKRSEERLTRLEQAVAELAEAQKRTEQRVEELAEAQKRSEERLTRLEQAVAELAEAQKRTEQRVEELAELQKRTEQRVEELAEAQKRTASQLGRLAEHIGVSVEQEAADELCYLLRQKGYTLLEGPFTLPLNGEIDVVCRVVDPQGKTLTAVLEAKLRLGNRGVEDWAQQMRSSEFRQQICEAGYPGPYLVYVYGLRIQPSAYEAVKRFGIGLLTDRGEHIEPQELFD
jgi:DNA repair exonuclease SbcCD ATPase subunit